MAVFCLIMVVTSCGSGSDSSATADDATESVQPADDVEAAQEDTDSASNEPQFGDAVGAALGVPLGDDDEMQEFFVQIQRDVEVATAECMVEQGFEYTPQDFSQFLSFDSESTDTRDYATTKGFGISTQDYSEIAERFEDYVDPNAEYVAGLSAGELGAYQTALRGYTDDEQAALFADAADGTSDFPDPAGCAGEAQQEAFFFEGVFDEFGDELENLEARVLADQRVVDATRQTATCLGDAGYLVADVDELKSLYSERFSEIVSDVGSFENSEGGVAVGEGTDASDTDSSDGGFSAPKFTSAVQQQIDELAAEEIAAATAAWDCGVESREIERQVGVALEQEFLAENGARIDEIVNG